VPAVDPNGTDLQTNWRKHYGVGVVPARPYKPRDKAKVENGGSALANAESYVGETGRFSRSATPIKRIRELLEKSQQLVLSANAKQAGRAFFGRSINPSVCAAGRKASI
jgi:hypothetical protein